VEEEIQLAWEVGSQRQRRGGSNNSTLLRLNTECKADCYFLGGVMTCNHLVSVTMLVLETDACRTALDAYLQCCVDEVIIDTLAAGAEPPKPQLVAQLQQLRGLRALTMRGQFAWDTVLGIANANKDTLETLSMQIDYGGGTLRASTFSQLSQLHFLNISSCNYQHLEPGVFANLSELRVLFLYENGITSLPAGLFDSNRLLQGLSIRSNPFTHLNPELLTPLTNLRLFFLYETYITELPAGMLATNTLLTGLWLQSNRLHRLATDTFASLDKLQALDISDNQLTALEEATFSSLTTLALLAMGGNDISGDLARVIAPMWNHLDYVNFSYNPRLTISTPLNTAVRLSTLDISHTAIPISAALCQPNTTVVARNMVGVNAEELSSLIPACLEMAHLIDVSENAVLSNLTFLQDITASFIIPLPVTQDDPTRAYAPVLQMEQAPVQCVLRKAYMYRVVPRSIADEESFKIKIHIPLPVLKYSCQCNPSHIQNSHGICEPVPTYWSVGRLIALVMGCVGSTLLISLVSGPENPACRPPILLSAMATSPTRRVTLLLPPDVFVFPTSSIGTHWLTHCSVTPAYHPPLPPTPIYVVLLPPSFSLPHHFTKALRRVRKERRGLRQNLELHEGLLAESQSEVR